MALSVKDLFKEKPAEKTEHLGVADLFAPAETEEPELLGVGDLFAPPELGEVTPPGEVLPEDLTEREPGGLYEEKPSRKIIDIDGVSYMGVETARPEPAVQNLMTELRKDPDYLAKKYPHEELVPSERIKRRIYKREEAKPITAGEQELAEKYLMTGEEPGKAEAIKLGTALPTRKLLTGLLGRTEFGKFMGFDEPLSMVEQRAAENHPMATSIAATPPGLMQMIIGTMALGTPGYFAIQSTADVNAQHIFEEQQGIQRDPGEKLNEMARATYSGALKGWLFKGINKYVKDVGFRGRPSVQALKKAGTFGTGVMGVEAMTNLDKIVSGDKELSDIYKEGLYMALFSLAMDVATKPAPLKAELMGYYQKATQTKMERTGLPGKFYFKGADFKKMPDAERQAFRKDMGLSAGDIRTLMTGKDVEIEFPASKAIYIVDRPWFAKVKGKFGLKPTSIRTQVIKSEPIIRVSTPAELAPKPVKAPAKPVKPVDKVPTQVTGTHLFPSVKPGTCGECSTRSILSMHGKEVEVEPATKDGISPRKITSMLNEKGVNTEVKDNIEYDSITPQSIVYYPKADHYVTVESVTPESITVNDSDFDKPQELSRKGFEGKWLDADKKGYAIETGPVEKVPVETKKPLLEEARKYKTVEEWVSNQPAKDEIINVANKHPLVKNKEKIKDVYIVGSFVKGKLKPESDIDIVLVVDKVEGMTEQDLTNKYRKKIQQYFIDKDIKGVRDDLHPQIMNRRADIYYKYEVPTEGIKAATKAQLTAIWEEAKTKKPALTPEEQRVEKQKARISKPREISPTKPVKPIITQSQKQRIAKQKEVKEKQFNIEKAEDAKKLVHSMIRDRRFFLNLKNYETNLFTNSIEKVTSKKQREIIPFLIEKSKIPEALNRSDLIELQKKESKKLQVIAKQVKEHFDKSWKFMKEHNEEISVQQIENYVTHLWDVPKSKKQAITNWFVTQNRFLKKRYIETYKKGIEEYGLKPKTLDISEIIRVHDSIMNKVIANNRFVKQLNNLRFEGLPLIARVDKAPENWVYFDHPALRKALVIPGDLKKGEKISDEFKGLLKEMGVAIGRRISPVAFGKPTAAEGFYVPGAPPEIRLKRFFETKTLAHEVGHHLDKTLKLGQSFLDKYKDELYAINRDRIEAHKDKKGKYDINYARSAEEQIAEFFAELFVSPDNAYKLAPNAMADILNKLKEGEVLTKLIDFDFETKAKNLLEEQTNTLVKLPVRIHPDLEKPLKVVFDSRFDHEIIRAYEAINGLYKKSKLSLSLFHHLALGETGIATMGLGRVASIYFNPVRIYKAMVKGELDIFKREESARKWIGRGLQVGATADVPVAKIQRGLNTLRERTRGVPGLNITTKLLASFNEVWDKALWNYLHDTLKLYGCESLASKIDPTKDIIAQEQEIAQMVNDTFGGQNWEILMVSPKTLQLMTWGLLSADWTTSTIRQALAPTGFGAINKESKKLRRKLGRLFWIKAALYFGIGINLLNRLNRKRDMEENPQFYKDQEWSFVDTTMFGNSIGHKTHLFAGRYKDGKERYIRWGKQFRELPEMFYDDTGFSPVSASLKKMGGKTAPLLQLGTVIATGVSPSGFVERDIYGKKGWNRTWGIAKTLFKSPVPFSTRSLMQEGKEFHLTDLAMPSSKGMSRYKSIELFKIAIERKDERLFKEIWQDSLRNNIPPYDMFKTALTFLKATNTKEINSKIKTIKDVNKAISQAKSIREKQILYRKKTRLMKEKIQMEKGGIFLRKALIEMKQTP